VIGGALGTATVVAVTAARDAVVVRFAATEAAPPPAPVDLVVAVPRPKVLSRLVQVATAFGVTSIHLTRSWRVDKAYLDSPRLAPAALALDARLGAEQGATTHLPAITHHDRFMQMIDAVPVHGRAVVAHPIGAVPIEAAVVAGDPAPVVCAIGPEGGWIEREVATFVERGYVVVSIGAPILRVESAVAALLGQLALLRRAPRTNP
jgi:16S rRNA (uracil1498-N3)-methyltransferase